MVWGLAMRISRVVPGGKRLGIGLYAVRSWVVLRRSGLFDTGWYELQTGRSLPPRGALWHYVTRGRRQGLSPHPLYEPQFADPERWNSGGLDAFAAYLRHPPRADHAVNPLLDDLALAEVLGDPELGGADLLRAAVRSGVPLPAAPTGLRAMPARGTTSAPGALEAVRSSVRRWRRDVSLREVQRFTADYDRQREQEFLRVWRDPSALPTLAAGEVHVSVVLPCWNREEQVVAAVRSVQAQTLGTWELLVVDDGSTDSSVAVVERLAAEDPRIVLLRQAHSGVCAARNLGLAQARGRFVAFLDSDNEYLPDFLQVAVASMAGLGLRAGYAILRAEEGDGAITYRTLEADDDVLRIRNFVDLNVLVVERDLLEIVGGFDASLRRTVDYDLVLRLRRHTELPMLPFLAVQYHHDATDDQRITNRESASWVEVVQSRAFVDWQGLAGRQQVSGRTSVVAIVDRHEAPRDVWQAVGLLLASFGTDEDVEVVLVDNGAGRCTGIVCDAWALVEPRVQAVHEPVDRYRALATNLALAACTGDVVVVAPLGAQAEPGWVAGLRSGLVDPGTVAVQPLLISVKGTVVSAGAVRPPGRGLPVPLLADHPVEDARAGGPVLRVPLLDDLVLAVRFGDLVAAGGLDPLFRNAWDVSDLSLRLSGDGRALVCLTQLEVTVPPGSRSRARAVDNPANRRIFGDRWGPGAGSDPSPWDDLGLRLVGWQPLPARGAISARGSRPLLARLSVSDRPVRRRWAIKTGAPAGPDGRAWGDVHFAAALAAALRRLDQDVVVDSRSAHERSSSYLDDVVLSLRGLVAVNPSPGAVSICWMISHPDMLSPAEARLFDRVVAASLSWSERTSQEWGMRIDPLLQCTDASRFVPPGPGDPVGPAALFVGNSRNVFRTVVRDALEAGLDLTLFGSRWEQFVGAGRVSGEYVPNSQLAALYGSCGVLLNDHWEDMRREGFLSNRLFDATATGARVITDPIEGVQVFDGLVRSYQDVDDLRRLAVDGLDAAFPPLEERLRIAGRVRRDHSFDARAAQLVALAAEVEAERRH